MVVGLGVVDVVGWYECGDDEDTGWADAACVVTVFCRGLRDATLAHVV